MTESAKDSGHYPHNRKCERFWTLPKPKTRRVQSLSVATEPFQIAESGFFY